MKSFNEMLEDAQRLDMEPEELISSLHENIETMGRTAQITPAEILSVLQSHTSEMLSQIHARLMEFGVALQAVSEDQAVDANAAFLMAMEIDYLGRNYELLRSRYNGGLTIVGGSETT